VRPDEAEAPDDADDDLVTEVVAEPTIETETLADMLTVLSGCHTSAARAQRALELVLSASGAPRGFLFLVQDSLPRVAAPLHGEEPLPSVTGAVRKILDESARAGEFRPSSRFVAEEDYTAWVCRLLPLREGSETSTLGAVVLYQPEGFLPKPPAALLEAVARRLFESGDAAPAVVSEPI
jgi:transglutaminase-like putative cysteine protease